MPGATQGSSEEGNSKLRVDESSAVAMAQLIKDCALPEAIEDGDKDKVELCEDYLAQYRIAMPNTVSSLWQPSSSPRSEAQVREMFAYRMPEYGYQVIVSQESFPDWLLLSDSGEYVYAEVEHRSSSFMLHKHRQAACDLIVCWEHDDQSLRVPVLELFSGVTYQPEEPITDEEREQVVSQRASAFGDYAKSRLTKKSKTKKAGRSQRGSLGMSYGIRVVQSVYTEMKDRGVQKTEAVKEVAYQLQIKPETVWTLLGRFDRKDASWRL